MVHLRSADPARESLATILCLISNLQTDEAALAPDRVAGQRGPGFGAGVLGAEIVVREDDQHALSASACLIHLLDEAAAEVLVLEKD
jgi:hypothetical protein